MSKMMQSLSRRDALTFGAAAVAAPLFAAPALALAKKASLIAPRANYVYDLRPMPIADGVWVIPGAADKITATNGGAIANVTLFDTTDGVVIVDTGPSHRYGTELAALIKILIGKPVARVYVTHIHADHSLGATAFDANTLYGPPGLAEAMKLRGNDITNAMYRVAGDWMRDTNAPEIQNVAKEGVEQIGQRKFHCLPLAGHTKEDLCIYEETSGLLLSGDIVFLDRAATTPDANIPVWHKSLATLAAIPHAKLVPGHGPVEPGQRGIDQTSQWLDFVDTAMTRHFNEGLDEIEIMATSMPDWTNDIAVSRVRVPALGDAPDASPRSGAAANRLGLIVTAGRAMTRIGVACTALACTAALAVGSARAEMSGATSVPEPKTLWLGPLHGQTPATLAGAKVVDVDEVAKLVQRHAVIIDVANLDKKPPGQPADMPWKPIHRSIPGATWMPGAGSGTSDAAFSKAFDARVEALTGGDKNKPCWPFATPPRWGSWNAANG